MYTDPPVYQFLAPHEAGRGHQVKPMSGGGCSKHLSLKEVRATQY